MVMVGATDSRQASVVEAIEDSAACPMVLLNTGPWSCVEQDINPHSLINTCRTGSHANRSTLILRIAACMMNYEAIRMLSEHLSEKCRGTPLGTSKMKAVVK